jgi:hypothetical protein
MGLVWPRVSVRMHSDILPPLWPPHLGPI